MRSASAHVTAGIRQVPGARRLGWVSASLLLLGFALWPEAQARGVEPVCVDRAGDVAAMTPKRDQLVTGAGGEGCVVATGASGVGGSHAEALRQLIVIGFMGGRVSAGNFVHREALLAKELQEGDPLRVHAVVFRNHDGESALQTVLKLLDENRDGRLSAEEKSAARIVIYGHSWGASETVMLARRLNKLGIPVLLTVQVDSVEKSNEDDGMIPPNVREAVNFYQTEGLLHGRRLIAAMDPKRTTILGNYELSYRKNPVSCEAFPWFARVFMGPHIEIENDPSVWGKIADLIRGKVGSGLGG